MQGTLALAHSDDFAAGTGSFFYIVRGDDGRNVPLKLPFLSDSLERGMRVIASGVPASDGFSLDTSNVTILAPAADPPTGNAPTTNNTLVILVKFTDSPALDPFTAKGAATCCGEALKGRSHNGVSTLPWSPPERS